MKALLFGFLVVLIASIIILSLVPPISKDALVHHLALPKLYLKHGGIYEILFMPFSYFPMNLDLLYVIPLYFGNDIVPKFMHFSFALLTAGLIFYYLKRRTSSVYGLLGALFFLSIPIIVKLSITVYVDLGEIYFSLASLLLLLKWIKSGFRLRFLIFSGVLCGLALGTKYNGLVTLAVITLFVPFLYSRYHISKNPGFTRPVAYGMVFFLISLLVFSPWMIRNYHWKSNPIYPLHNKLFNPTKEVQKNATSQDKTIKMNRGYFTYRSMIYNESGWEIALLPLRIFFEGKDGDSQYFDGKLNPFLFFLPFFAFYRLKHDPEYFRREKKIMLVFSILFFGFAFFSSVLRVRYISPIIPPLVMLSVFGVKNIIGIVKGFCNNTLRQIGLTLVFFMLAFSLALNASYVVDQFRYVDPFNYLNGALNRDEYISKYRFEYPAIQYINKNLPSDANLLFIFLGKRGYYCERKYVLGESTLWQLLEKSYTPEEVLTGLKNLGITHLFIYHNILEKWAKNNYHGDKEVLLQEFLKKYVKLLYYKNGFSVSILGNPLPS